MDEWMKAYNPFIDESVKNGWIMNKQINEMNRQK